MGADELGQLFRRELLSAGIEQYEITMGIFPFTAGEFQQSSFILERNAVNFSVLLEALEVFVAERLDFVMFGLADPCDGELHEIQKKILTPEKTG